MVMVLVRAHMIEKWSSIVSSELIDDCKQIQFVGLLA